MLHGKLKSVNSFLSWQKWLYKPLRRAKSWTYATWFKFLIAVIKQTLGHVGLPWSLITGALNCWQHSLSRLYMRLILWKWTFSKGFQSVQEFTSHYYIPKGNIHTIVRIFSTLLVHQPQYFTMHVQQIPVREKKVVAVLSKIGRYLTAFNF